MLAIFSAKDGAAAALKLWEKPWWNGSQKCKSFRLWMFSKGGSMGDWDGTFLFFVHFCSKVLWKNALGHHWEILGKILFSFFMPFQIIFKFSRRTFKMGEKLLFHCFFSKSNLHMGWGCIKTERTDNTDINPCDSVFSWFTHFFLKFLGHKHEMFFC